MKKTTVLLLLAIYSLGSPLAASEGHMTSCGDPASPLLSVADFDASGKVTGKDISTLARHIGNQGSYYALYDRNGDGKLDEKDIRLARQDINNTSTQLDREIAGFYNRFKHLQTVRGFDKLMGMGYFPIPVPLKGHGVHWFNAAGQASMMGHKQPNPNIAEGLNVSTDQRRVHALFYATPGSPVFDNGATDYPHGDDWKDARVIAFDNMPDKFTSSDDEMWHTHAGLCMPLSYKRDAAGDLVYDENGLKIVVGEAHQYTTYNECQAMSSDLTAMEDGSNMWANFWMLHMWLYDPNPNGLFAGIHPCVEQDAPDESVIIGDREVPEFFDNMH